MPAAQALVLAGHGSHHDRRSATPVFEHADRIRERGCFDTVRAAFWKEQPSLAEVLATVEAETTYVVPVMTSEGYFADRVFPRELGLMDPRPGRRDVRYTDPVGTHERLVDVVLDRVASVLDDGVDVSRVGVAVVGHGTDRHAESATATAGQAERLRSRGRFAAVEALFLDQSPRVGELATAFDDAVGDIVVVPLFIADGGHVTRDVPEAMGLPTAGEPFGGPTAVDGKRVWYTRSVGTAPALTDVILERAAEAGATVRGRARRRDLDRAERAFCRWLEAGGESTSPAPVRRPWGELAITVTPGADGPRYAIRHRDDRGVPTTELDRLQTPAAVRELTGVDEGGNHRPLRTARTLPRGWLADGLDREDAVRTVRAVYPASIDHWYRERAGTLDVTSFESVVDRQAGRYRGLDAIEREPLEATVEACCGDCVRRRTWPVDGVEPERADGAVPCPEPCAFLLEAARSFCDAAPTVGPADERTDPAVPAAAFEREGNRSRVRFRRAMAGHERDRRPLPP